MKRTVATTAVLVVVLAGLAFGHGKDKHVKGTVTAIGDYVITVETLAKESKKMDFDSETKFVKDGSPATYKELQIGDRVVIDVFATKSGHLHATSVRFGSSKQGVKAHNGTPQDEVRHVIEQFEQGLGERNLGKIEPLMATDLVAFENGHRNDGWQDFRDHHLVPEMQEPAPPMKSEVVRITATPTMGWGYTKTTMTLTRKGGEKVEATLWSVYVVEKRSEEWEIVMLDWSFLVPRPSAAK